MEASDMTQLDIQFPGGHLRLIVDRRSDHPPPIEAEGHLLTETTRPLAKCRDNVVPLRAVGGGR